MIKYILTFAFVFTAHLLIGQGWERIYSGGGQDEAHDVKITPDSGYIMTGIYNGNRFSLIKVDVDGFLQWSKFNILSNASDGRAIEIGADSSYYVAGFSGNGANRDAFLLKTNFSGDLLWNKNIGIAGEDDVTDLAVQLDGSVVVLGNSMINNQIRVVKTTSNGTIIWSQFFGVTGFEQIGKGLTIADNGDIIVVGLSQKPNIKDIYVARISPAGNLIWEQMYSLGTSLNEEGRGVVQASDGNFVIAGTVLGPSADNKRGLVIKIDGSGDPLPIWYQTFAQKAEDLNDIAQDASNGFVITGVTPDISGVQTSVYIARITDQGVIVWENSATKSGLTEGLAVGRSSDGGYVAVGYAATSPSPFQSQRYAYMVRTDANGQLFTNYLSGNVYSDSNTDCTYQPGEPALKNWLIRVSSPDFTKYTTTRPDGSYFIMVDTGVYDLKVFPPNSYWATCSASYTATVNSFYDTITTDIGLRTDQLCPYNEVDIQTPILRRCTNNRYTVRYCNSGTVASQNTRVIVEKSQYLSISAASVSYIVQGDSLIFNVGLVLPGNCNSFTIDAFLDCDVDLSTAHCMKAHITPDTYCGPTSNWDGAVIEAKATCKNGRVNLSLANKGINTNANDIEYVIIEDVIVLFVVPPSSSSGVINNLDPGEEELVFDVPANGKTYRILSQQTDGYPGMSVPTAAVEGCKVDTTASISTGFYTMFPEDDAEPFAAADCQEANETNFNPDYLKRGHPKGYKEPHYIKPETDIDYLIHFQNTGTDTVQRVIIRDTLSPWLDPATVRPGTASHPYTYSVYGDGIVQFTLSNINLTPSGSSNSEGYVKFRVSQKPVVPCGTELLNRAAIWYDFNALVLTNETYHTVCDSFVEIAVQSKEVFLPGAELRIYPNPFVESTVFEVTGVLADQYLLEIVDAQGRLIFNHTDSNSTFRLFRHQLPTGLLFYRLVADGRPVASGKLLVR